MAKLTLERAKELLKKHVTEKHLFTHALAVSAAMGAMAEEFGEKREYWEAIGYLHDVDFEKYPEEHLDHVRELLDGESVDEKDIRAILAHGYGIRNDVEPLTDLEKSLFTVDELTGIVMTTALMRPNGISDLEVKSVMKKFKDRRFAAKCDRDLILKGCEMLSLPLETVIERTIEGMRRFTDELNLGPKAEA
ncbi:MAG TPA: HD domain-containing protein [Clostridia bacterium]|nr:HD domain-containing protein [Clostridia bacterium]